MRCFACDTPSGARPFVDPLTGRCYCSECWSAIMEDLNRIGEDEETTEVEEDQFDPQEIQNDSNWEDFNLPSEDYDA